MNLFKLSLMALAVFVLPLTANAQTTTKAKQAYIVDFETGQALYSKNADEQMPTSSMSKVMTMYMVFDAIKDGDLSMDSELSVSEKAWSKGGSKMFVEVDKKIKVADLARGVIIQSGNDATIVLAEGLAGSEDAFAKTMTEKAISLGMENSNFVNASGWPDENHYSTAKDLSVMAKAMIKNFPDHYKMFSEKEFTYNNIKQQNRNPLLYKDIGADGLKTGHTEAAGYGLIGTAERNGRRVIMVVNGLESEKDRADEATRLINWGLDSFVNMDVLKNGQEIAKAPVVMGQAQEVSLIIKDDVRMTVPKAEKGSIQIDVKYKEPLIAPVLQGQEVGTATIRIPSMPAVDYPIYAASNIEEVGFFKKMGIKAKKIILGKL